METYNLWEVLGLMGIEQIKNGTAILGIEFGSTRIKSVLIDSNYQVTCARDTRTGSTAVDVHNASTVSMIATPGKSVR